MQAAHIAPRLPGASASGAVKGTAILMGAFVLVGFVPIMLFSVSPIGTQGGHLPWPVLQWAVTTPGGALLLMALCLLVLGPPHFLLTVWQLRREVARAIDVTGLPLGAWPGHWPTHPQRSSIQRWLGHERGERALSLALFVLGALLAVALAGTFIASAVLWRRGLSRAPCVTSENGCQPTFFLMAIPVASVLAAMALLYVARARWLRRVEAISHVWLRYRDWSWPSPLCYVCQPGVTPETVAAALAPFSSTHAVPFARQFFTGALVITPYALLVSASFVLSAWLQLQWIPG